MKFFRIFLAIALSLTFTTMISAQKTRTAENPLRGNPDASRLADRLRSEKYESESKTGREEVEEPASNDLITATSYAFLATTAVLEDMSSGTTPLVAANVDDTASPLTNIGFEFVYDGIRYGQFSCNANGICRLGGTVISTSFDNSTDFASTTNAPKIAPYFDDMWVGTNGSVRMKVIGAPGSRKLIVEWNNMQIPRVGTGNTGAGTFQLWLFEQTGVIQFVYGTGVALNSVQAGYTIGLQSGAATNLASVTNSTGTVSYAAANNTQTNAITAGTSYVFTPNAVTAPSGGSVTAPTPTTLTVNWADNSANEVGFLVYRSTDNVNFTFAASALADATSLVDGGLNPSTNYFYRVYSHTEGAMSSTFASGSGTTGVPPPVSCNGAGGNWNTPGTWSPAAVPAAGDAVTIQPGCTVIVDTAGLAYSLTVNGVVEYEAGAARAISVGTDVTVGATGIIRSSASGTITTHALNVTGNVVNNGTIDFSTNGDTAGGSVNFTTGVPDVSFAGAGSIDIRGIGVAKGARATVVNFTPAAMTVRGAATDAANGFLTLTSGTFRMAGTATQSSRVFTTAIYNIPLLGGLWIDNPNFTVSATASGTTTNNNGLLRITQGVYNIGVTGADGMGGGTGAVFTIEGGTINATRIDPQNPVTYTQTGGTVNMGTVANTRTNFGTFELFSTTSSFSMSGGTINLVQATVAATPIDLQIRSTPTTVTGGVVNIGTGATATNFNFRIRGLLPNTVVDNTTNPKTATMTGTANISSIGLMTVNNGSSLVAAGAPWLIAGPGVVNNGTITMTIALGRMYFLATTPQTYSGSGTTTIVSAGAVDLTMDNPAGLTIAPGSGPFITQRVNFFRGGITNANEITIGNGGTTPGVMQYGLAASVNTAGNFDVAPNFNIGTGGQTLLYAQEGSARTIGVEVNPTRSILGLTVSNTNGVTLSGGDLTSTGTVTLTAGVLTTGNSVLVNAGTAVTRTTGYVNGNLQRPFTAAASYTYMVGQGFYSPVVANVTAVTGASSLTARAFDNTLAGFNPALSLSRNWSLEEAGDLTADLTFTYDASDENGNEADYRVYKRDGLGVVTNLCPGAPCVNTATNSSTGITGVTSFSRWTMAELLIPTAASLNVSGRVLTANGVPVRNVLIAINGEGISEPRFVYTSSFGYYNFEDLPVGSYVLSVNSKRFSFANPVRFINLNDNLLDEDFVAEPMQ